MAERNWNTKVSSYWLPCEQTTYKTRGFNKCLHNSNYFTKDPVYKVCQTGLFENEKNEKEFDLPEGQFFCEWQIWKWCEQEVDDHGIL